MEISTDNCVTFDDVSSHGASSAYGKCMFGMSHASTLQFAIVFTLSIFKRGWRKDEKFHPIPN